MIHHLLAKGLATVVLGGGAYKAWQWYQGRNAPTPPGPSPVPTPQPGPPAPSPSPVNPGTITGAQPGDTNGIVTTAYDEQTGTGDTTVAGVADMNSPATNPAGADPNNPTGDTTTSSDGSDSELVAIASDASGALGVLGAFGL